MGHGGKGSSPRPFSVSQEEFANSFEKIFGKKEKDMQVRVKEDPAEFGKCGCGRSPDGKCCGWHGLTEEQYQAELLAYETVNHFAKSWPKDE
jgi:hypothetical protein